MDNKITPTSSIKTLIQYRKRLFEAKKKKDNANDDDLADIWA